MISNNLARFTLEPAAQTELLAIYTEIGKIREFCDPYMEEFLTGVSKLVEQLASIEENQLGILADMVDRFSDRSPVDRFPEWSETEMQNEEIVTRATAKIIECCTRHLLNLSQKDKKQTIQKGSNTISEHDLDLPIIGVADQQQFNQMGEEGSEDDADINQAETVQRVTSFQKYFSPSFEDSYCQFLTKMFRKSVQMVNRAVHFYGKQMFDEKNYTSSINHCCSAFMVLLQATIGCMSFFESLSSEMLCNSDTLYGFIKGLAEPHELHLEKLMDDPLGLLQDVISMSKSERVYTSCLQTQAGRLMSSDNMKLMGLNSCFITWAIRDIEGRLLQPDVVARLGGPMLVIGHCASSITDSEPRIIRMLINSIQYVTYFVEREPSSQNENLILENICYLLHFIRLHFGQVLKWVEKTNKSIKVNSEADQSDQPKLNFGSVVQGVGSGSESQQRRAQSSDRIPEYLRLKHDLESGIVRFLELTASEQLNRPPVSVWFADTIDAVVKAAKGDKNNKEFFGQLMLPILTKVLNHDRGSRDRSDWDVIGILDTLVLQGGPKTQEVRVRIIEILEKLFNEYFRARERSGARSSGRSWNGRRHYHDEDDHEYGDGFSYSMNGSMRDSGRMDPTELHTLLSNLVPICTQEKSTRHSRHPKDTGLQGAHLSEATQTLERLLGMLTNRVDQHQLVVMGEFIFPLVRLQIDLMEGVTEACASFLERLVSKSDSHRSMEEKEFELILTVFGANPTPQLSEIRLELLNTKLQQIQTKFAEICILNIKPRDVFKNTRVVFSVLCLQRLILNHGHTMPPTILAQIVQNLKLLMNSESILKGSHTASLGLICSIRLAISWCPHPDEELRAVEHEASGLLNVLVLRLADAPLSYLSSTRSMKLLALVALLDGRLEMALYLARIYFLSEGYAKNEAKQAIEIASAYKDLQKYLNGSQTDGTQEADDKPKEIYDEDEDEEFDFSDYRNTDFSHPKQRRTFRRPEPDSNQMTHMVCSAGRLLDWTDRRPLDIFDALREHLSAALRSPEGVAAAREVLQRFPAAAGLLRVHRLERDLYKTDFVQAYRIKRICQSVRLSTN